MSPRRTLLRARLLLASRRLEEAASAAAQAAECPVLAPAALVLLGRARHAQGRRADALAALRCAAEAGSGRGVWELLRCGGRASLPVPQPGVYAPAHYASFVAAHPTPAPPSAAPLQFAILLDGSTEERDATLTSLNRQSHAAWSLGEPSDEQVRLSLPAGAQLDPHALAWLAWALHETGASEVRADHDHFLASDGQRDAPVFLPQSDFLWLDGPSSVARLIARRANGTRRIAHVPLVLMTLPEQTSPPATSVLPDGDPQPLSVVIPTRDNPAMLGEAIDSLLAQASRPDLIEVVVVDNDSRTHAARSYLAELAQHPQIRIEPFPEAFNWCRANNLGARRARGDALLFVNDDTLMLTSGWDRILRGLLDDPRLGVIGSRLLYPNGRIQHGGFVMAMDNGPQHEGRWCDGADPGPSGRWQAVRLAPAVTGAFMALSRARFDTLGGFDEQAFAIDFADLDICLRARASGAAVAYCGAITLTHYESVSRGLNLSRAQRRRAAQERARFQARWGDLAHQDPWYHPAWVRTGCSYDGLKPLTLESICEHIKGN